MAQIQAAPSPRATTWRKWSPPRRRYSALPDRRGRPCRRRWPRSWRSRGPSPGSRRHRGAETVNRRASLISRVRALPSSALPVRPSVSLGRTGTPVPSTSTYSMSGTGSGGGSGTDRAGGDRGGLGAAAARAAAPDASADRSMVLALTATPARSASSAAALGEGDLRAGQGDHLAPGPATARRPGQCPAADPAARSRARSRGSDTRPASACTGPSTVVMVLGRLPAKAACRPQAHLTRGPAYPSSVPASTACSSGAPDDGQRGAHRLLQHPQRRAGAEHARRPARPAVYLGGGDLLQAGREPPFPLRRRGRRRPGRRPGRADRLADLASPPPPGQRTADARPPPAAPSPAPAPVSGARSRSCRRRGGSGSTAARARGARAARTRSSACRTCATPRSASPAGSPRPGRSGRTAQRGGAPATPGHARRSRPRPPPNLSVNITQASRAACDNQAPSRFSRAPAWRQGEAARSSLAARGMCPARDTRPLPARYGSLRRTDPARQRLDPAESGYLLAGRGRPAAVRVRAVAGHGGHHRCPQTASARRC